MSRKEEKALKIFCSFRAILNTDEQAKKASIKALDYMIYEAEMITNSNRSMRCQFLYSVKDVVKNI